MGSSELDKLREEIRALEECGKQADMEEKALVFARELRQALTVLFCVLLGLKITGAAVSWWVVFAPLYVPLIVAGIIFSVYFSMNNAR